MIEIQGKYNKAKVFTDNIQDTAEVVKIIKPVYNFKAAE